MSATTAQELTGMAKRAYEAYGRAADWRNHVGKEMPEWKDLPPQIHVYWVAAVRNVLEEVKALVERKPA